MHNGLFPVMQNKDRFITTIQLRQLQYNFIKKNRLQRNIFFP